MSWRYRKRVLEAWLAWWLGRGRAWLAAAVALALLGWGFGLESRSTPGPPLLMLEGRTYVVVSHLERSDAADPALLLREERTGRLEWRRATILISLADGVSLSEVLADVPVASFVSLGPHQYRLSVAPTDFSKAHRALLTDWRVLRTEVPLLHRSHRPSVASGQWWQGRADEVLKKS